MKRCVEIICKLTNYKITWLCSTVFKIQMEFKAHLLKSPKII